MDPSEFRPSPRRELQGPRPTPLKVSKDSYKIKKPPIAPVRSRPQQAPPVQQQQQPRQPVIIYTVSPKIIHTKPSDFMTLVQRLTGPNSSSDPSTELSFQSPSCALSPAARIAVFEKSSPSSHAGQEDVDRGQRINHVLDDLEISDSGPTLNRPAAIPGILSPLPSALPPISPDFFSPSTFDPSVLSFLHELSPVLGNTINNNNRDGSSFLTSPGSNLLSTPVIPTPGACWDLLSQLSDF